MNRARRTAARIADKPVETGSERAIHSDPYAESTLVPAGHPDEVMEICPHCGTLLHTHTKVGGSIMKCPRCGELSDAAERLDAQGFWAGRVDAAKAAAKPRQPSMKTFTIEVSGASQFDVEMAIDEVKRLVSEGYQSGSNENDTGSFSFDSSGEYGHSEENDDEPGQQPLPDRGVKRDCPSCDAALPQWDVRSCPECGSAIVPEGKEWGGRECYACNARLYGDEMTCPDCGAEQKPLPGGPHGSERDD